MLFFLLGGANRQESAHVVCWGGDLAPRSVKTKKAGSPKPKRFRQRFGYFAAEGKVTRAGARNISIKHTDKLPFAVHPQRRKLPKDRL